MYPYVRCHCGLCIGALYEQFLNMIGNERYEQALDRLGLAGRECCRAKMLTTVEFTDYYYYN